MSYPAPPPSPAPENVSTGESDGRNDDLIGWRLWAIDGRQLVAPFARSPLPVEAAIASPCVHPIYAMCEWCGISYFPNAADAAHALAILDDPALAITAGQIVGRYWHDPRQPLYRIAGLAFSRTVTLPAGRRCDEYQVTDIYADLPVLAYDNTRIHPLESLDT